MPCRSRSPTAHHLAVATGPEPRRTSANRPRPTCCSNETVQNALALNQHSRNLLLVERNIADDAVVRERARIRAIASPEGACCVERLLEPYPSMLERQLARMRPRPPVTTLITHPLPVLAVGLAWQPGDPATPAAGRHARRLPAGLRRSRLQARHRLSRCLRPSRLQPFAIVRRDPRRARRPRLPAAARRTAGRAVGGAGHLAQPAGRDDQWRAGRRLVLALGDARYFMPFHPIAVSPIGLSRFLSERGLLVLQSEARWVWLPCLLLALAGMALRFLLRRSR